LTERPANHLKLALGAMFLQQTFISLGKSLPAVIAPAIIADLRLAPSWIGIYFGITAIAALFSQLGCGSFIVRYGALRMSQVALVLLAVGTAFLTMGSPWILVLSAIVAGGGAAVSTPTSSHLLSRCSPPQYLPLVFSIKQTAVPAGLLIAGILAPQFTEWTGWRTTMLITAAACLVFAVVLQPLRKMFDDDRVPTRTFKFSDFKSTLNAVMATPRLRALSFACLAFNGAQTVITAYFVVYLTTIGYTPVAAGFMFSIAVAIAIPGRILWGWIGSRYVSPRVVMAGLPMRTPLATIGGFLSKGIAFLLTVMPALPSAASAAFPVRPFENTSTSIMWLSVPPLTSLNPPAAIAAASRAAFAAICRW